MQPNKDLTNHGPPTAISTSISSLPPFIRAGGRTFNVRQKMIEPPHGQQCEEWQILDGILFDDLLLARRHLDSEDSQFWRRTYCRYLLTLFEGIVQSLKVYTLDFFDGMLSEKEKKTLAGRQGALEGAFNGLDRFMDVAGASTLFKVDTQEWLVVKNAISIRNRISHPSNSSDLNISDSDLLHLRSTEVVILELFASSLEGVGQALLRLAASIQERLERNNSNRCSYDPNGTNDPFL